MKNKYKPIEKPIYVERIELKPGDALNINFDLKISTTKEIVFDKVQLEAYIYNQIRKYLKKHEKNIR